MGTWLAKKFRSALDLSCAAYHIQDVTRAAQKDIARQMARALAEGKMDVYRDLLEQLATALKG